MSCHICVVSCLVCLCLVLRVCVLSYMRCVLSCVFVSCVFVSCRVYMHLIMCICVLCQICHKCKCQINIRSRCGTLRKGFVYSGSSLRGKTYMKHDTQQQVMLIFSTRRGLVAIPKQIRILALCVRITQWQQNSLIFWANTNMVTSLGV